MKNRSNGHAADRNLPRLVTGGEVFSDGTGIELARHVEDSDRASLLFSDGTRSTITPVVKRHGRIYEPPIINQSIWRELVLPTRVTPCHSARELLDELSKSAAHFVGLPEKLAAIAGRIPPASWIIRALPTAPAVSITGPAAARGNRFVQWLQCVCRHALPISGVSPAALRSLPSGLDFTLIISQSSISDKLAKLLDEAGRRDTKIPHRGGLIDLYGLQIVQSESVLGADSWCFRSLKIPILPTVDELPIFDAAIQRQLADDFQSKLAGYRFANFNKAAALRIDASNITHSLRELAHGLAATTPDDADLQRKSFDLLREDDLELRSAIWTDPKTVAIESMMFACSECAGPKKYVSELAELAYEIRKRRGVDEKIDAGAFGKTLGDLGFGFAKAPRDAKGVKLQLSEAACSRAQQLARDLNLPELESVGN